MFKFILPLAVSSAIILSACQPEEVKTTQASQQSQISSLTGGTWNVIKINNQDVIKGSEATFIFEGDRMGGSTGCNSFSTSYEAKDGNLTIGATALTKMMCDPATNKQEQNFIAVFNNLNSYEFNNDALILKTSDGKSITAKK